MARYVDTVVDQDGGFSEWLSRGVRAADYVAVRTGFLSRPGVDELWRSLRALLERGGELLIVAGGAPEQADPEALFALGELVEGYPERASLRVVVSPEEFQNAKTYYLRFPDGHAEAAVGSANLTRGGMATNHEAVVILDGRDSDHTEIVDRVRLGIEHFLDRPGSVPVSAELRVAMAGRGRAGPWRGAGARAQPTVRWEDCLQPAMDRFDAVASRSRSAKPGSVPTGFADLDEITTGLVPGTFTVISSRPGVGKTTLLTGFARNASVTHNLNAVLFSLNQRLEEITQRILSAEAKIRLADMRGGRMSDDDWTRLARRMTEVAEAPLLINTTPGIDLDALCMEVMALHQADPLALVAIDSINMIRAKTEPGAGREREVAAVARRLKSLALELDVPVVATAELSRPQPSMIEYQPRLDDLRESDVIAQVADLVLLLHRPDATERDHPRAGEADIIIAKHTLGPTATVVVVHQLHYSRFADLAG